MQFLLYSVDIYGVSLQLLQEFPIFQPLKIVSVLGQAAAKIIIVISLQGYCTAIFVMLDSTNAQGRRK